MVRTRANVSAELSSTADLAVVRSSDEANPREQDQLEARTNLGRDLLKIRERIVASGQPLLDWAGIEREVADRRGGDGSGSVER